MFVNVCQYIEFKRFIPNLDFFGPKQRTSSRILEPSQSMPTLFYNQGDLAGLSNASMEGSKRQSFSNHPSSKGSEPTLQQEDHHSVLVPLRELTWHQGDIFQWIENVSLTLKNMYTTFFKRNSRARAATEEFLHKVAWQCAHVCSLSAKSCFTAQKLASRDKPLCDCATPTAPIGRALQPMGAAELAPGKGQRAEPPWPPLCLGARHAGCFWEPCRAGQGASLSPPVPSTGLLADA
ncbi:hypothetical protein UY3_13187 [Chelonia mydas]|uniref:Uncharacterized protein n=1 Tax=Chelonia mydas TaxID=8469 RepID=M7AW36_CHEMY|nr:hypothetical protein UY3_13187 [Chelonia mydas]